MKNGGVKKGGVTTVCSPEVRRSQEKFLLQGCSMSAARSDIAFAARDVLLVSRILVHILKSEVCCEKFVI